MLSVEDALQLAGIAPEEARYTAGLSAECARLTRLLREASARRVGLVPAAEHVGVPAIALALGRSLAEGCAGPVGVIDAMGTWGCARELTALSESPGVSVVRLWLQKELVLLTPRVAGTLAALELLLQDLARGEVDFEYLLVDLTGVERRGERRAAIELLDAAVLVARSGRTTARQARRALGDFPDGRGLGVLLTGP